MLRLTLVLILPALVAATTACHACINNKNSSAACNSAYYPGTVGSNPNTLKDCLHVANGEFQRISATPWLSKCRDGTIMSRPGCVSGANCVVTCGQYKKRDSEQAAASGYGYYPAGVSWPEAFQNPYHYDANALFNGDNGDNILLKGNRYYNQKQVSVDRSHIVKLMKQCENETTFLNPKSKEFRKSLQEFHKLLEQALPQINLDPSKPYVGPLPHGPIQASTESQFFYCLSNADSKITRQSMPLDLQTLPVCMPVSPMWGMIIPTYGSNYVPTKIETFWEVAKQENFQWLFEWQKWNVNLYYQDGSYSIREVAIPPVAGPSKTAEPKVTMVSSDPIYQYDASGYSVNLQQKLSGGSTTTQVSYPAQNFEKNQLLKWFKESVKRNRRLADVTGTSRSVSSPISVAYLHEQPPTAKPTAKPTSISFVNLGNINPVGGLL